MNSLINIDEYHLQVFHEGRKRRVFVGELIYNAQKDIFEFNYDKKYAYAKSSIPIGPELSLLKMHYQSEKGKLFPSFIDRIPSKDNPAYTDYCQSQGISPKEKNLIILLGAIGKRGPSSFIFEPVYCSKFDITDIKKFRDQLDITQNDFAKAFDVKEITLSRIESKRSVDYNTLKIIEIFLQFPEVALWQLKLTGGRVHKNVLSKLIHYFESKIG